MRSVSILVLLSLAAVAAAGDEPANRVVLSLSETGPEIRKTVQDLLRARLTRFGLQATVRGDEEGRIRVDLPPLATGQPARILRLLTSPGRLDIVTVKDGTVVVPAESIRGLVTSLVDDRVHFRLRLRGEARKAWAAVPEFLVLRFDGREVRYFKKGEEPSPELDFPTAYPREDLRVLFCCVQMGPLPATLQVVEKSFDAVTDPALAWADLLKGWAENPPSVTGLMVFRRQADGAVYTASTSRVERNGRSVYLLEDRLFVPDHPERTIRTSTVCDLDWSLLEGRIDAGGQTVVLDPKEVVFAPGVALRLAPHLPARPGATFGPGGRLRVRSSSEAGAVEVISPTRPTRILVRGGRVVSFVLDGEGAPFLPAR